MLKENSDLKECLSKTEQAVDVFLSDINEMVGSNTDIFGGPP